jgi:hypothetical protein
MSELARKIPVLNKISAASERHMTTHMNLLRVSAFDAFLDAHVNAPRRGSTEVLHRRTLTLPGGHPGRVLILRRNISGTPLRVYSRLYLVGRRLYSLIVSTLDVGGVSEDVVKKFMESFKLS